MNRIIFHVDVNSAYLSWEAARRLQQGDELDLRTIPSIIGGDPNTRRGIVLARSSPAKLFGVTTGESIHQALSKCPTLYIAPPDHPLYSACSKALLDLFDQYSPSIQPFSIDESFLDMSHVTDPVETAYAMSDHIRDQLGFTVNIGISTNKLLAKMASDFEKPNKVHTLFPSEIATKLWPLPIRQLYMVGPASEKNLTKMGIRTIGDLAKADPHELSRHLKSYGSLIYRYSHGLDSSPIEAISDHETKSIGNSTTLPQDVSDVDTIKMYLLALSETVARRLRSIDKMAYVVTVQAKDTEFKTRSHQKKLLSPTDNTTALYQTAVELFENFWTGYALRLVGVRVTDLVDNDQYALDLFSIDTVEQDRTLDATIDKLRQKFGDDTILRATFAGRDVKPMIGHIKEDDD